MQQNMLFLINDFNYMEREGYSGLSITSFIFSILGGIFFLLVYITVGIEASDETVGTMVIIQFLMNLIGLCTGIPSLFTNSQKRLFGILGVIITVATFIITLAVLLIGLSVM